MSRGSRRLRRLGGLRLRSADRMKPGGVCAMPGIWLEMRGGSICFGDLAILEHPERQRAGIFADGEEPIFDSICKFEIGEKSLAWPMWARGSMAAMLRLGRPRSGDRIGGRDFGRSSGGVRRSGMARSRHAVSGGPGRHVPGILGALAGMRASWADMPLSAAARQKEISVSGKQKLRNPELFDDGAAIVSRRAQMAQSALAERTGLEPATPA